MYFPPFAGLRLRLSGHQPVPQEHGEQQQEQGVQSQVPFFICFNPRLRAIHASVFYVQQIKWFGLQQLRLLQGGQEGKSGGISSLSMLMLFFMLPMLL